MSTTTRPWSDEEDAQLLALIDAGHSYQEAADQLDRSMQSVANHLLFLRRGDTVGHYRAKDNRCTWTPDQDSLLLLHYGSMSPDELAALVGKSPKALRNRISRLRQGQTRGNVLALPGTQPDARPADIVRLTQATLNRFLEPDYIPVESRWRAYDDFRLRLFYGELPLPLLAHLLGRTPDAVRTRLATLTWSLDKAIAFRLEVSRSPLWLEAMDALRLAPHTAKQQVSQARLKDLNWTLALLQKAQTRSGLQALHSTLQARARQLTEQVAHDKEFTPNDH